MQVGVEWMTPLILVEYIDKKDLFKIILTPLPELILPVPFKVPHCRIQLHNYKTMISPPSLKESQNGCHSIPRSFFIPCPWSIPDIELKLDHPYLAPFPFLQQLLRSETSMSDAINVGRTGLLECVLLTPCVLAGHPSLNLDNVFVRTTH